MKGTLISILLLFLITSSMLTVSGVAAQSSEKTPVIIGFKGVPDAAAVQAYGGTIKFSYTYLQAVAAELPIQAIEALQKNPNIDYIEPDYQAEILDITPWGVAKINADQVWSATTGANVKVAILDTGIDYTHPDLEANYETGYDFAYNDNDPMDGNGHGTHCAGIVAAADNNIGVVGVAPQASLYAVKVLDDSGSGAYSIIAQGIEWCITNDIDVISMSLSGPQDSTTLHDACDAAAAAGIVLVAAAGNSGPRPNSIGYPARYSSVIAVGATDSNDVVASFSSRGTQLSVSAPGVSIYSTYKGGAYATMSGTSMACPHVTGTVALMLAKASLSPAEVRSILQSTAIDLGTAGFDNSYGYGRINAQGAVAQSAPSLTVSITNPTAGSTIEGTIPIQASVTNPAGTVSLTYAINDGTPISMLAVADYYEASWNTQTVLDGECTVTVTANDGTSIAEKTITVTVDNIADPEKTLSVTVATDKSSYSKNQFVTITVTVKDSLTGNPLTGASVTTTIYYPNNGIASTSSGTTNSDGIAQFKYKVTPKAPTGTYTISATASYAGYTTETKTTTFLVN